jgi:hypothetical protein
VFGDDASTRRARLAALVFGRLAMAVGADLKVVDGIAHTAVGTLEGGIQTQFDHGTGHGVCAQAIEQIHGGIPAYGKAFVDPLPEFSERFDAIFRTIRVHRSISCSAFLST